MDVNRDTTLTSAIARRLALLCCVTFGLACISSSGRLPQPALAVPGWTNTTSLSEAPDSKFPRVAVAMDAIGDTMVVWCQSIGASESIDAAWRPAGGAFGEPVKVSPTGNFSFYPAVAMNSEGDATVAWITHRFGAYQGEGSVEAASRPAGKTFGSPVELSTNEEGETLGVGVNPQGNATVAWLRHDAGNFNHIEAASLAADGTFSKGVILPPNGSGSSAPTTTSPSLASNSSGGVAITWSTAEAEGSTGKAISRYSMRLSRLAENNTFGPTLDFTTTSESAPAIAMDATGNITTAWSENGLVTAAQLPYSSEALSTPTLLTNANARGEGILDSEPSVAMSAAGESLVSWLSGTQPVAAVLEGQTHNTVELAKPGAKASAPLTAMNSEGDSMTMWISNGGNHEGVPVVEGAARPAGRPFERPLPLTTTGNVTTPANVALDSRGDAVSAWATSNGTHEFIEVAGYQATGPQLESLQAPSEGQAGTSLAFSVVPLSVWSTVTSTTWSWGDGTPETSGTNANHTFNTPGVYQITVSATDALGNTTTNTTRTITIQSSSSNNNVNPTGHTQLPPSHPLHHAQTATSPFTPLFATRALTSGKILGILIEIEAVRGTTNGDTLVIRCIAGCEYPLHQVVHINRHHRPNDRITITKPLALRQATRIEIDVQAPHHITRFVQYRFVRTHLGVIAHIAREGCLSSAKRARACPSTS